MKKILLTVIGLTFFAGLFAQSFSLQDTNGVAITAGSRIYVIGSPEDVVITAKIWLKNNAAEAKDVKVKKIVQETQANTMNYFCWGVCYGPDTYESPFAQNVLPGAVNDQFYGDYNPQMIPGKCVVMYTFFDTGDRNDSVSVVVEFNASPASVGENLAAASSLSEAYPNPASSSVNLDYQLPASVKDAKIQITNMLGARVKEVALGELSGTARIDVTDLTNGIYFYSLVADQQLLLTRKFMVRQ